MAVLKLQAIENQSLGLLRDLDGASVTCPIKSLGLGNGKSNVSLFDYADDLALYG